jgi:hypothetical protein
MLLHRLRVEFAVAVPLDEESRPKRAAGQPKIAGRVR